MEWILRSYGTNAAEMALRNPADRSDELVPILDVVGRRMLKSEKRLFETSGRSGGQPWAALKPITVKRKKGKGGKKPLIRTGHEMKSLSVRDALDNLYRVTRLYVLIGSTAPGVEYQKTGTRRMKARPPIIFTVKQKDEWVGLVNDFIFSGNVPNA
jgi:hypothetical protein